MNTRLNPPPHKSNHIDTRAVKDSLRLARCAIQTSSFFAIRGRRGTGRSFIYDAVVTDWRDTQVKCESLYFLCVPDSDPDRVLRQIARAITGKTYFPWQRPTLLDLFGLIAETCRNHEAYFLFIDDFHHLSDPCWKMVLCLFDALKDQGIPIGMAVTTCMQTEELLFAMSHPAFLDTVWTGVLTREEMCECLAKLEPRLKPLMDAYFDGTPGAAKVCESLYKATHQGNFKTMRAVIDTICGVHPQGAITAEMLEECLALRRASASTAPNFALTQTPARNPA
jgi:hypothetical protein